MLLNFLIASAMITCFGAGITGMISAFAPGWNGAYLPIFSFLVALQALYAVRGTRRLDVLSRNWMLYRAAELVAILVLLKLLLYAIYGFDRLLDDLVLWRQDFVIYFFEPNYLLACLVVVPVWIASHQFAGDLVELEADDATLQRERENQFSNNREATRRQLMLKVVITGAVLVAFTVFTRTAMRFSGGDVGAVQVNVVNMLLYIALGLLLLSFARYTALRAAWFRERAEISPDVVRRWVTYAVLFLAALFIVALLLPTRYTIGLLGMLSYLISMIVMLLQFLFYIILFIITLPINLLLRLLGQQEMPSTARPLEMPTPPAQPPAAPNSPDPLLDLINSILFWVIFVGVIGFALVYFLRLNQAILGSLRGIPLLGWVVRGLIWLWNTVRQGGRQLSAAVEAGLRRLRPAVPPSALFTERRERFNLRRATARERVQYFYLAMVRRAAQRGLPRSISQTPREYAEALDAAAPEVDDEINALTESFVEARYSRHDVTPEDATHVQSYWERIRAALRRRLKKKEIGD